MADVVLDCHELRKRYGTRMAVDGVSFQVAAGECYGLLGPNGAGKTTTISMVCGLLAPDGGEVQVDGRRVTPKAVKARAAIGYVPQDVALYPNLTGTENLRFFGRLYGLGGRELADRVAAALDLVGLSDRAGERVERWSGGMRRRANIAVALLHRPQLLVLDEPTVGVDPQSRNAILEAVGDLAADGMAVVYASHYMEEVERLCDRVGILDEGRMLAEGTRAELVALVGGASAVELTATGPLREVADACQRLPGVTDAAPIPTGVRVVGPEPRHLLPQLLEVADGLGAVVSGVEVAEPNLEAVFLHLTGKALRD